MHYDIAGLPSLSQFRLRWHQYCGYVPEEDHTQLSQDSGAYSYDYDRDKYDAEDGNN